MEDNIESIIKKLEDLKENSGEQGSNAEKIVEACRTVGRAWSGSSLVGHAKFFYGDFKEPDVHHKFSIEWGLIHGVPEGWVERGDEDVIERIESISGQNLTKIREYATIIEQKFIDLQRETVLLLAEKKKETSSIENFSLRSATNIFNDIFPTRYMTRDTESMTGNYIVPHIYYQAIAMYVKNFPGELKRFIFETRKIITIPAKETINDRLGFYVENSTIVKLSEIKSEKFDLTRLVKLCKELNDNYSLNNYLSCGMVIRSILDHIPPIFGMDSFEEVSSNYGSKSFKNIVKPLQESTKKIADSYLHTQIREKEILPTKTQISFQPNIDFILQEIIRILK